MTILVRDQLGNTIARQIPLTLGLLLAVFHVRYRARWWMRIGVFILYLFGCFVFSTHPDYKNVSLNSQSHKPDGNRESA